MIREPIIGRLVLPPGAFRLVLAVAVVVSHVSRFDIGRLAVLLFFFLSGYWVAKVYKREFQSQRWGAFYASRWLRIIPLYLIVMVAAALARGLPIGWENLSLLGVASTHQDPTGVAWSLDIELQFYLLLPLLLIAAVDRYVVVFGTAALTGLGWWASQSYGVNTAFMYLPAFALGAGVEGLKWKPSERVGLISLAAFVAVTAILAAIPYTAAFLNKRTPDPFEHDLFAMLWMLPLVPYVAASLAKPSTALDRDVGNWSYPLYLVHVPLIAVFATLGLSKWLAVVVAFGLALALFYGPDRFFERVRRWALSGEWRRPLLAAQPRA